MNKGEFVAAVTERGGFSKAQGNRVANMVLDIIKEELVKGEPVSITGFGSFTVDDVAERTTNGFGKETVVPAHKRVRFKAGSTLKKAVNG